MVIIKKSGWNMLLNFIMRDIKRNKINYIMLFFIFMLIFMLIISSIYFYKFLLASSFKSVFGENNSAALSLQSIAADEVLNSNIKNSIVYATFNIKDTTILGYSNFNLEAIAIKQNGQITKEDSFFEFLDDDFGENIQLENNVFNVYISKSLQELLGVEKESVYDFTYNSDNYQLRIKDFFEYKSAFISIDIIVPFEFLKIYETENTLNIGIELFDYKSFNDYKQAVKQSNMDFSNSSFNDMIKVNDISKYLFLGLIILFTIILCIYFMFSFSLYVTRKKKDINILLMSGLTKEKMVLILTMSFTIVILLSIIVGVILSFAVNSVITNYIVDSLNMPKVLVNAFLIYVLPSISFFIVGIATIFIKLYIEVKRV